MNLGQAWHCLGISRTGEVRSIRSAYAARLKAMEVDQDVEGYARLREARDIALAWAKQQAGRTEGVSDPLPPGPAQELEPDQAAAAAWPYGAPFIEHSGPSDVVTRLGDDDRPCDAWPAARMARRIADSGAPDVGPVLVAPLIQGRGDTMGGVLSDRGRDAALYELLLGKGVDEGQPLGSYEEARAGEHLRAILRQAAESDLARQDNIEQWLAEIFARAWPRSAPLLEPAATAFGWEQEVGKLGERPAMAFLVARLRGLRFHRCLLEPRHQFHRAWLELSRPGPAGTFKRLHVSGEDVRQLLEGIRRNFPELEQHLDPQRVYSWESPSIRMGSGRFNFGAWWIGGIIVLQILMAIGRAAGDARQDAASNPAVVSSDLGAPANTKLLDDAVADIFGAETTFARVAERQPELADTIRSTLSMSRSMKESDDAFRRRVANIVRERMYEAGQAVGGAHLVAAMRLRLGYLQALQSLGPGACMDLYRLHTATMDVRLPPEVHEQEQKQAAVLLREGRLGPPGRREAAEAKVPGDIVKRVRTATGLSIATIRLAMQQEGSDADRCAVTTALLAATLDWRGKERETILRTL